MSTIIEIPTETEEQIKAREDFKLTLDIEIFARFMGLYIMKLPIPDDIYQYVKSHKSPSNDLNTDMIFAMLLGNPNIQDENLRQLIKNII